MATACNSTDDNTVNINDFSSMQRAFGRTIRNGRYNDCADLTGDPMVNVHDYNMLKVNFGRLDAPPIVPVRP